MLGEVFGVRVVGDGTHGRQAHKALTQALHATALLIHRQQQIRTNCTNGRAKLTHLTRMLNVARENDQAAHFGLTQQLAIFGRQPGTGDVHHQRALQASSHRNSLITKCAHGASLKDPARGRHTTAPPRAMPGATESVEGNGSGSETRVGMGG
ncbi:hypothetical protein D3C81_1628230 [compost metagenome]